MFINYRSGDRGVLVRVRMGWKRVEVCYVVMAGCGMHV